jgi:hypothetical protein
MADLHKQFAESFEPEPDGKTPVTVRGFDWYEDTAPEDYLEYALLLEKFAIDLLARYDATILPRFMERYRQATPVLLSDEVTTMLAEVLGPAVKSGWRIWSTSKKESRHKEGALCFIEWPLLAWD